MAGGNFDSPLHIGAFNHRVEWPVGPLTLDPGETALYVEAWVVQASTGSAQSLPDCPEVFDRRTSGWRTAPSGDGETSSRARQSG